MRVHLKASWLKRDNIAALLVGIFLSLLMSEFLLRFSPPAVLNDDIYSDYTADVGWLPIPNDKAKHHLSCLHINPIHINKYGFRDKEWVNNGEFTIAILGDSVMQAKEAPEGVHFAAAFEKLLGYRVLNAGVNNFGTLHEYLAFKKYLLPYKPQIVILAFLLWNDVVENSYKLRRRLKVDAESWPSGFIDQQGNVKLFYPETVELKETGRIRNLLKYHCKTCLLGKRIYDYISIKRRDSIGIGKLGFYDLYMPENPDWAEAWKLTQSFLVQLKESVDSYGGKLFIVSIPEYIKLSKTWEQEFKQFTGIKELPAGFDLNRPISKLKKLTRKNNIPLFELEQPLLAYIDAYHLTVPYLSYRCDGHYNPLGHFLAANLVAQHLLENDFVPMDSIKKATILERINTNLKLNPETILTAESYDQIYNRGYFIGQTNIPKILAPH